MKAVAYVGQGSNRAWAIATIRSDHFARPERLEHRPSAVELLAREIAAHQLPPRAPKRNAVVGGFDRKAGSLKLWNRRLEKPARALRLSVVVVGVAGAAQHPRAFGVVAHIGRRTLEQLGRIAIRARVKRALRRCDRHGDSFVISSGHEQ